MKKNILSSMLAITLVILLCGSAFAQIGPGGSGTNEAPEAGINVVIVIIPPKGGGSDKKNLDGTPSFDVDGEIVSYEWDLDGDGSFETGTGSVPYAEVDFEDPGQYWVGLRVTDDDGASDSVHAWVTLQ